jgi:hypothetical protein
MVPTETGIWKSPPSYPETTTPAQEECLIHPIMHQYQPQPPGDIPHAAMGPFLTIENTSPHDDAVCSPELTRAYPGLFASYV